MKISISQFDPEQLVSKADLMAAQGHMHVTGRSTGLHLSAIYEDLDKILNPQSRKVDDKSLRNFGAMGFVFEYAMGKAMADALSAGDPERYVIPGEFELDGITMSPDLIDTQEWMIVDTKVKWKSVEKLENLEKFFWKELVQMKAYCHGIQTNRAQLLMFFVMGNWKWDETGGPQIKRVDLEFTRLEMLENWKMLVQHAVRKGWLKEKDNGNSKRTRKNRSSKD